MSDLLKEAIADAKAVRETALQNAKMAFTYYAGNYNVRIDCLLIDPSNNHWVFQGDAMNFATNPHRAIVVGI